MNQWGATLYYAANCDIENAKKVLTAIKIAVEENWHRYKDEWSEPMPGVPVDIEDWCSICVREKMTEYTFDGLKEYHSEIKDISYSPVSTYLCWLSFWSDHNNQLAQVPQQS